MSDNSKRERHKLNLNLQHNLFWVKPSTKASSFHPTVGTTTKNVR